MPEASNAHQARVGFPVGPNSTTYPSAAEISGPGLDPDQPVDVLGSRKLEVQNGSTCAQRLFWVLLLNDLLGVCTAASGCFEEMSAADGGIDLMPIRSILPWLSERIAGPVLMNGVMLLMHGCCWVMELGWIPLLGLAAIVCSWCWFMIMITDVGLWISPRIRFDDRDAWMPVVLGCCSIAN
ncbi:hypothetical protein Nepgr_005372 [Nepenthes gracilis]|uniref:Uncharacterized protein n=1 Tax=Nepenthes gracilis TaxID=150966 RepID=A0AAD3S355_NEPGR|nr:hypothetical protein Nepgr_005372 [Nepenthes gracilis]